MVNPKSHRRFKEPSGSRSRSFGGCATCRIRHMKCDEGKPTCLMCKHFGTTCGGYEKNLIFATEGDDGAERFRRPLFTEQEREEMSVFLVSSIPSRLSLLNVLSQIDEECEDGGFHPSADLCVQRGPFGAFRLASNNHTDLVPIQDDFEVPFSGAGLIENPFSPSAFTFSPGTQAIFDTFVQTSDSTLDLPLSCDTDFLIGEPRIEEVFGDSTSPTELEQVFDPLTPRHHDSPQLVSSSNTTFALSPPSLGSSETVPKSAVHLLKHYSTIVISLLTPSRNTKTLWHILFLPFVKNTLAALSMGETLDHASLSAFYGTLAISAFHLKAMSKSQQWYDEGCGYKQRAREHIRLALRTAYHIPKVAKYKSILMALLTMVQVSMFDGDWKQTECYLLESEKFIRLRGLHRRKSRKRRLLHHCYAFMRILHESLFLITTHSLQRIHVRLAVESSGLVIRGQDSPTFRLSSWRNLVQKMLEVKNPDEGENDLHLENPGFYSATMYPEIYGLPEEWLVMLSQVIRLGNEKDPQHDGTNTIGLKEFSVRAKDLEQCIINWHRPPADIFYPDQQPSSVDERVLRPLLEALHQSLIIYFYRRIHDLDASMLQKRVEKARDNLLQCDAADPGRIRYTSVFMWPAFIAGCEADEPELQACFGKWFEDCVVESGQSSFKHMHSIINQVWQERSHSSSSTASWLDYMKDTSLVESVS